MSCIYLEITSGTAWGLMNSQTAGNSAPVFSTELSVALCLFIHCCFFPSASPQQQTCPVRQQGPWICKGCIPPPPVSFADPWLTVGLLQRKAISLTAWLLFQGNADLLHAPHFPRSHWAIQEITADTEPFVSLLCSPLVTLQQKTRKKTECSFLPAPWGNAENYFCNPQCGNFGGKHTKKWIKHNLKGRLCRSGSLPVAFWVFWGKLGSQPEVYHLKLQAFSGTKLV